MAWATEGGLCYFHANPDKAAELGRNGGRRRKPTYQQATKQITPPESAADVRRMLAEVMADIRAGKMDPKLGTTLGYVGTALLRAFEIAPRTLGYESFRAQLLLIPCAFGCIRPRQTLS